MLHAMIGVLTRNSFPFVDRYLFPIFAGFWICWSWRYSFICAVRDARCMMDADRAFDTRSYYYSTILVSVEG